MSLLSRGEDGEKFEAELNKLDTSISKILRHAEKKMFKNANSAPSSVERHLMIYAIADCNVLKHNILNLDNQYMMQQQITV